MLCVHYFFGQALARFIVQNEIFTLEQLCGAEPAGTWPGARDLTTDEKTLVEEIAAGTRRAQRQGGVVRASPAVYALL